MAGVLLDAPSEGVFGVSAGVFGVSEGVFGRSEGVLGMTPAPPTEFSALGLLGGVVSDGVVGIAPPGGTT